MDPDTSSIVQQVESLAKLYSQSLPQDSGRQIRRDLQAAVSKLSLALDTSGDIIDRFTYMPMNTAVIRIAIDLGIFNLLVEKDTPMTTKQLAEATGAEYALLGRVLRNLAAISALDEVDVEKYTPTKIGRTFATEKAIVNLKCLFDSMEYGWHKLPSFLAETQYRNPTDPLHAAIQKGLGTDQSFFSWIQTRPKYLADFNIFMRTQREARANWLDFYPLDLELGQSSAEHDTVAFVDIGGGLGHEIQEIRSKYPHIPGRMILQDLPINTDQVPVTDLMEPMGHDFFAPQPVIGARIYYFRSIFHNWANDKCELILRHTSAAMTKGYSKLLINEFVIPNRGASAFMTHIDLNMMTILAAMERTEQEWRTLIESAGLKIIKIWTTEPDSECIIETTLA